MNNGRMPTNGNFAITKPSNAFTYIINIFTGYCHNNITSYSKLLFFSLFLSNKIYSIIYKEIIINIYLAVMNARKSVLYIIFFLKITAA